MLYAMRNGRAPTATAPADGCIRAGPKSGSRPCSVDLDLEALVLSASNIGELDPFGATGGPGVEVDREVEPGRDPLPEPFGQLDALVHRRVAERDERHDVDGPDARVLAGLLIHVDLVDGDLEHALEGFGDGVGVAGEGEDAAVVARIARPIEEVGTRHRSRRVGQSFDDVEAPPFGHVRDGFDEERHGSIVTRRRVASWVGGASSGDR